MAFLSDHPIYRILKKGRPRVAVHCSSCSAEQVGSDKPNCPVEILSKHFTEKGWRIRGNTAVCPACQVARPSAPVLTETQAQELLQRQQQREEQRRTRAIEVTYRWAVDFITQLPDNPAGHGRNWLGDPEGVAKLALILRENDTPFLERLSAETHTAKSTLQSFMRGQGSNKRDWPKLRTHLRALGVMPDETTAMDTSIPPSSSQVPSQAPPAAPLTAESREVLKAQARLYGLLTEHFTGDGFTGVYDAGYDDSRLARDTGLSVETVVRVREAVYGRIVDPRLGALENDLKRLTAKAVKDVEEMRQMVEAMAQATAAAITALELRLAELQPK